MREGAKRFLFRWAGARPYSRALALGFRRRLGRALSSPGAAEGFFGPDLLAFAADLRPGQIVLDIGAYLGGSTALFCRAVGGSGRVYAFEPAHYAELAALARRMRLPARIEPLALASRSEPGEMVIPLRRGVPLYSQAGFAEAYVGAGAPGPEYAFERRAVRRARLDEWLAGAGLAPENVAAAKIDVEGSEIEVFRGGEGFFRRFSGALLCEFWFGDGAPPGWEWLRARGYRCRYLGRDGSWRPADTREEMAAAARGETYRNFLLRRAA